MDPELLDRSVTQRMYVNTPKHIRVAHIGYSDSSNLPRYVLSFRCALTSPSRRVQSTFGGRSRMMSLMSRWRVRKVSREEESMGFFVVDMSVVAIRKVFSQSDTKLIASQSEAESKQDVRSDSAAVISDTTYVLTASLKSRARPEVVYTL
jgi:hypothetical protein